jgi:hypothetical protein
VLLSEFGVEVRMKKICVTGTAEGEWGYERRRYWQQIFDEIHCPEQDLYQGWGAEDGAADTRLSVLVQQPPPCTEHPTYHYLSWLGSGFDAEAEAEAHPQKKADYGSIRQSILDLTTRVCTAPKHSKEPARESLPKCLESPSGSLALRAAADGEEEVMSSVARDEDAIDPADVIGPATKSKIF